MKPWVSIVAIVLLVLLGIGWTVLQWNECRQMGHSLLYCIGHVSR